MGVRVPPWAPFEKSAGFPPADFYFGGHLVTAPANPVHRREAFIAALIIAGAAAFAYHNTFSVPFIFDDSTSIEKNPTLHNLLTAWSPPKGDGYTVSGRPFLNFTLALNYAVNGYAVW